jgi:hypothetical protein
MVQTSMQYTPVQVLQAARRAEAEGKMDYALQFYRHLVEQHGATPEAQEAREGLFRIAEWRWGEARIARRQDGAGAAGGQFAQVAAASPPQPPKVDEPVAPSAFAGSSQQLPQTVSRGSAGDELIPLFKPRYRVARIIAYGVSGLGMVSALAGTAAAVLAGMGAVEQVSTVGAFGFPIGLALGVPAALLGLVLLLAGQLALAVFESANANLEMLAIERGRASF